MLVVNLFGAPGAGKSTGAAYIFSRLKMAGVNAELITEFAKDMAWEENKQAFANQAYIFGNQSYRLSRCKNKVQCAVTDSPLLLSSFYNTTIHGPFHEVVKEEFDSYNNLNFFINRAKPYNPVGRIHTEQESDAMEVTMKQFLESHNVAFTEVGGTKNAYDWIVFNIMNELQSKQ